MNSPVFTVIEARPWHCGRMARLLRIEHASAIARLGIDSHRELSSRFGESAFRRAWLIDGELAALGGVTGPQMAAWGFLWLALTERARRYPVAIVKEAKRQLAEIMVVKRELATTILDNDAAARRLAIFLGFHVADEGRGAPARSRFARRDLSRFLDTEPAARMPIGNGYVIAMGYHHDEAA
jgi:hypothetical protein